MITRKNHGAPSSTTPGNVGDYYIDIDTGKVYQCVDVTTQGDDLGFVTVYANGGKKNTTYIWKSTGASSWNDLEDKPFYVEEGVGSWALEYKGQEELVLVETRNGAETLTRFSEDLIVGNYIKISDTPLTNEQAKTLVLLPNTDKPMAVADIWDDLVNEGLITDDCINLDDLMIIQRNTPLERAIQFYNGVYVSTVLINSLNGPGVIATFMDEVVHPIDPKFLPDGYPYEEEKVVKEPLDITFSNMDGLDVIHVIDAEDDTFGLIRKLSDADMTVEQIKNFAIDVIGAPDGDFTMSIAEDWDRVEDEGTDYEFRCVEIFDDRVEWYNCNVTFILKDNVMVSYKMNDGYGNPVEHNVTYPTKGIYAVQDWTFGGQYTMRIYAPEVSVTKNVTHPIDPKFLPNNVGGGVKYVTIDNEYDENDDITFTSSATYDEIAEWIAAGMDVKCIYGAYVLNLIFSNAMSDVSTFVTSAAYHRFAGLDFESGNLCTISACIDETGNVYVYEKTWALDEK